MLKSNKRYVALNHVLTIILLFGFSLVFANSNKVDSLQNLLNKSANDEQRVVLLIQLVKTYRYFDINSAVNYGNRAIALANKIKKPSLEIEASIELAKSLIEQGAFEKGLELLNRVISVSREINAKEFQCDALSLTGYIYRRKGNSESSRDSYERCYKLSTSIAYKNGMAHSEKGFGDLNERQGKYFEALENYNRSLHLARSTGDQELEANVLNAMGIIYDYQGNLDRGLEYYLNAMVLAEQIGNLVKASGICGNIASVHFYLEHDDKALQYYLKAIEMSRASNYKNGLVSAYQGVVMVYNRLQNLIEAKKYALLDLELRTEMGDKRGLSYSNKNLGVIYQAEGKLKEAEEYYLTGLKYAEETDQKMKIAVLNLELGRLMNKANQAHKAIPYLEKTLSVTKEINVIREQSLAYEDLATSYAKLGKMDLAFENQKKFSSIKDELLSKERTEQTIKMQTIYETAKRDFQIASLEEETQLKDQVIKQASQLRNLSLIGLGLAFIIIGLVYNRYRTKGKLNDKLSSQNKEIESQRQIISEALDEKELLLKEIHHRVKNNLQIISSLLSLQSRKIRNEEVLISLQEGQNRVEAMSLIHQNLYQRENLSAINMNSYTMQLMENLSRSFNGESRNIEYSIDIDDIDFDIDTAVPIGLIINELVTNAYKHAFTDRETGQIKISIKAQKEAHYFCLRIEDNGRGIPEDLGKNKQYSLGQKLVHTLGVRQLKGNLEISNKLGTNISLKFKDLKKEMLA